MQRGTMHAWALLMCVVLLAASAGAFSEDLTVESVSGEEWQAPEAGALSLDADGLEPDGLDIELPDLEPGDGLPGEPDGAAEGDGAANGIAPRVEQSPFSGDAVDNDRLFAGYVDLLFGERPQGDLRPNGFVGDTLTGMTKKLYDLLLKQIKKVSAGSESRAVFWIPTSIADYRDWDEFDSNMTKAEYALVMDYPYDLFWYNRFVGAWRGYDERGVIYVMFTVSSDYANWNGYTYSGYSFEVDKTKIHAAQSAARNAKKVVKKYAGKNDYDKLCAYRDYICSHVDYNYDVNFGDNSPAYVNPWQVIWAFDNDPSTNIICEGYAKAFQYLCDLSRFKGNIQSFMVVGDATDSGGSGTHMWNIVTMDDGRNYHVDITFVDGGMTEAFLCGGKATGRANEYRIKNEVVYTLDEKTVGAYPAKRLKLSTRDYKSSDEVLPRSVELKKGKTTLKKGQELSLKWGKSLTLKAVVSPSKARTRLTWTSSYTYVTVKDGKVTVNKKAKVGTRARITVKTANKKSTYIYIVVK